MLIRTHAFSRFSKLYNIDLFIGCSFSGAYLSVSEIMHKGNIFVTLDIL